MCGAKKLSKLVVVIFALVASSVSMATPCHELSNSEYKKDIGIIKNELVIPAIDRLGTQPIGKLWDFTQSIDGLLRMIVSYEDFNVKNPNPLKPPSQELVVPVLEYLPEILDWHGYINDQRLSKLTLSESEGASYFEIDGVKLDPAKVKFHPRAALLGLALRFFYQPGVLGSLHLIVETRNAQGHTFLQEGWIDPKSFTEQGIDALENGRSLRLVATASSIAPGFPNSFSELAQSGCCLVHKIKWREVQRFWISNGAEIEKRSREAISAQAGLAGIFTRMLLRGPPVDIATMDESKRGYNKGVTSHFADSIRSSESAITSGLVHGIAQQLKSRQYIPIQTRFIKVPLDFVNGFAEEIGHWVEDSGNVSRHSPAPSEALRKMSQFEINSRAQKFLASDEGRNVLFQLFVRIRPSGVTYRGTHIQFLRQFSLAFQMDTLKATEEAFESGEHTGLYIIYLLTGHLYNTSNPLERIGPFR